MENNEALDEALDALGRIVIIGNFYGYAANISGTYTVTTGRVKALTASGRVSIAVKSRRQSYRGRRVEVVSGKATISVSPMLLFPVRDVERELVDKIHKAQKVIKKLEDKGHIANYFVVGGIPPNHTIVSIEEHESM